MNGTSEQLQTSDPAPLIRRGRPKSRFTAIANSLIEHPALSLEARMALIYLLSKPEDWRLQVNDLRRVLGSGARPCGRDKTYGVVNELKAAGYIRAERELREGRFHRLVYYVFDEPESPGACVSGTGAPEQRAAQNFCDEWCPAPGTALLSEPAASPFPENPDTAQPDPGGSQAVNQDLTKDGKIQKPESPPDPPHTPGRQGLGAGPQGRSTFDRFWADWPDGMRPQNRRFAARLFNGLSPAERILAVSCASDYRSDSAKHGLPAKMIPYLRGRRFSELVDAPPLDGGYFVITPDRPEWEPWLRRLRTSLSERTVAGQAAKGVLRTTTRWPPPR